MSVLRDSFQVLKDVFDGLTDVFSGVLKPDQPSRGGVYQINPVNQKVVINDEDLDDIKAGAGFRSDRRRSTSSLLSLQPSNTSNGRRYSQAITVADRMGLRKSEVSENSTVDDFGLGSLILKLSYFITSGMLEIHIQEAQNLPPVNPGGTCNSYVLIDIYPGRFKTLETSIIWKSTNPRFNERKTLNGISETDLKGLTMKFKLCDCSREQNEITIGEINFRLSSLLELKIMNNKKVIELQKNIYPINPLGLLHLSLLLNMNMKQLTVTIIRAKDLNAMNGDSCPYCSIKLYSSTTTLGCQRTSTKYKSINPIWNESFNFPITRKNLEDNISIQVKIVNMDPVKEKVIGKVVISENGNFTEARHWGMMRENPKKATDRWHSLQPNR